MLPNIVIDGRLVADSELRFTQQGKAVCSFRVAASDSKKDDAGNWNTTEQIFINVTLWDAEAEAAAEVLQKGDQVIVTGRIYEREYETREGEKRKSLEVKFPTVAKKIVGKRADRSQPAQQQGWGQQPAADPWGAPGATSEEPPF